MTATCNPVQLDEDGTVEKVGRSLNVMLTSVRKFYCSKKFESNYFHIWIS